MADYTPDSEKIVDSVFRILPGAGIYAFTLDAENQYQMYQGQNNSGVWKKCQRPSYLPRFWSEAEVVQMYWEAKEGGYPDTVQVEELNGKTIAQVFAKKKIG